MSSTVTDPSLPLLAAPAGGVPPVVDTPEALHEACVALASRTGPVALDTERASGIRYGDRAFLLQLKREDHLVLVDPETLDDLSELAEVLDGPEWILHAATQDLPSLRQAGLHPARLFDTELAARILGWERFGLAAVVAETVGVRLAKEHSNVDWSTRPLPAAWLNYAALDVEVLIEVREHLLEALAEAGKTAIAEEEFTHLLGFDRVIGPDSWRKVNGAGGLRSPRALARLQALWTVRDTLARESDTAASSLMKDKALVALAKDRGSGFELVRTSVHKATRAQVRAFHEALLTAEALPPAKRPRPLEDDTTALAGGKRSMHSRTELRDLVRDRRANMRAEVAELAEAEHMPPEILLAPRTITALANRIDVTGLQGVVDLLHEHSARTWQIDRTAKALVRALQKS